MYALFKWSWQESSFVLQRKMRPRILHQSRLLEIWWHEKVFPSGVGKNWRPIRRSILPSYRLLVSKPTWRLSRCSQLAAWNHRIRLTNKIKNHIVYRRSQILKVAAAMRILINDFIRRRKVWRPMRCRQPSKSITWGKAEIWSNSPVATTRVKARTQNSSIW